MPEPKVGAICWQDLTVPHAAEIRDFYSSVVGWGFQAESMGEYEDYSMLPPGETTPVAGICHQRGCNAEVPSQWLLYILVDDVAGAAERARARGGRVLDGPRAMGGGQFCVIRDPAGAVFALYSSG